MKENNHFKEANGQIDNAQAPRNKIDKNKYNKLDLKSDMDKLG